MHYIKYAAMLLVVCLVASGCSVGMALSGKREPQINDIQKGMGIDEVHLILRDYTPAVSDGDDGLRIEEYEIQLGNAPSGGRALGHAAMDVLTLGLWEVVGTPVEAVSSGTMNLRVTYKDDVVTKVQAGRSKDNLNS